MEGMEDMEGMEGIPASTEGIPASTEGIQVSPMEDSEEEALNCDGTSIGLFTGPSIDTPIRSSSDSYITSCKNLFLWGMYYGEENSRINSLHCNHGYFKSENRKDTSDEFVSFNNVGDRIR